MTKDTYLPVDDKARTLVHRLASEAEHASLAVPQPGGGHPVLSLIAVALIDGMPFSLVSTLAEHARAMEGERAVSLLFGTPGKGDPLAHPRFTLFARAEPVRREKEGFPALRAAWLAARPKAALYIDFADFYLVRFEPLGGLLNGGFGRAHRFDAQQARSALSSGGA